MEKIGKWAFIAGLIVAALAGLGVDGTWVVWVLAILGLVVGFLNVTGQETHGFLLAAIALILSATAVEALPFVGELATDIVVNIVVFLAPAVLVVALKTLLQTAKER
ncbi:MAG: hypothetical protein OER21_09795 [Gemmatimonadota bacterium]|nr:hypothetical protein [Gemmatimonadota bacterium]